MLVIRSGIHKMQGRPWPDCFWRSADPEGGGGQGVWTLPWNITSYMGFYREWAIGPPPPPPGKSWTPSGTLKNDRFLWNWPFDFCKISWGLKKKKKRKKKCCQSFFFVRLIWTPPDENSWISTWVYSKSALFYRVFLAGNFKTLSLFTF